VQTLRRSGADQRAADQSGANVSWAWRLVTDILFVAKRDRKWWMLPLVLAVLVMAGLIAVGASLGPLAPFLYPLF
jgi:hypothetical protein